MNQDNNFNSQGNNGISNNQPLNSQSFNYGVSVNQQTAPSFQQPIMQESISQPTNNTFENGNASNQSFNSKPPKKLNLGLIIGIVAVVAVVGGGIVFGSKLLSNRGNNDNVDADKTDVNSSISFEFDGNSYEFANLTMKDLIEAGWVPNLEYAETKNIEETIIKPYQGKGYSFLNDKYPDFELNVMAHNYTNEEGIITSFPISELTFDGLYSLREKTSIPTLKLKKNLTWGATFENAKKIYGTPKENNDNKSATWAFSLETNDMIINDTLWIMFEEENNLSRVIIRRDIEEK